jgi:ABC-2 type transport system ATP-binding protein
VSGPIVSLSDVTGRFGEVTAIERLSLDIRPAVAVALLGPNGAGKTTTLELMLGLLYRGRDHLVGGRRRPRGARVAPARTCALRALR